MTRGVCVVDANDYLAQVVETSGICMTPEGTIAHEDNGSDMQITPDQHVSMNMWGFTPDFLNELEAGFKSIFRGNPGWRGEKGIPASDDCGPAHQSG